MSEMILEPMTFVLFPEHNSITINYYLMQGLANYGLWAKSGVLPDLVKFIGTRCLHIVCGCFHVTTADLSSYTKTIWPWEPKILTVWLVKEKICQPLISTIYESFCENFAHFSHSSPTLTSLQLPTLQQHLHSPTGHAWGKETKDFILQKRLPTCIR